MDTLRQIKRIIELHHLIQKEITGSSSELSRKLYISRRSVFCYLEELRMLGAYISYDTIRRTYYYTNSFDIQYHLNIVVGAKK